QDAHTGNIFVDREVIFSRHAFHCRLLIADSMSPGGSAKYLPFPALPAAGEGNRKRYEDQPDVQPETMPPRVEQVVAELVPPRYFAVAVDLGQPRQAWPNLVAQIEAGNLCPELFHQLDPLRTRAHEAHITPEDTPELRELVHRGGPQDSSHLRYPGVVCSGGYCAPLLVGVRDHGAELQARKDPPVFAHALLPIKDRAAVVELHGQGNNPPQGQRYDKPHPGQ